MWNENLIKILLPTIFIFLLCLGLVSTTVLAKGNGHGNDGHGKGKGNGNNNGNGKSGNGKNGNAGSGKGRNGNGGNGKGKGHGHGHGRYGNQNGNPNGNANGNANVNRDGTSDAITPLAQPLTVASTDQPDVSVDVVQHVASTPVVEAPVMALSIAYPTTVGLADDPAWWNLVESNVENLFRKFFFLTGSVGEKIRRKNVLRNGKRREIYYFIVNNPFSHFRRITRTVGVGPNEGSWHLKILEKMGLIKGEHIGRYLTYHANNADYVGNQAHRPPTLIQNTNATKILEYVLRNPGTNVTNMTQALTMNRNTLSYHIKRMQTCGLIEREETNGLRLVHTYEDHGEGLTYNLTTPMDAAKTDLIHFHSKFPNITNNVDAVGES